MNTAALMPCAPGIADCPGVFSGSYRMAATAWTGPDSSRTCWIFPGQGAAFPGMFAREFRELPQLRSRLAEADALAAEHGLPAVSDYLMGRPASGPELALQRILALFTANVAGADRLLALGRRPALVTAFSFGEMSALVSIGLVPFADMFLIVVQRERFCPPPFALGSMIAVSATPAEVAGALSGHEFHVSNLAAPRSVVISVRAAGVDAVRKALRRVRLAAVVLSDVPQTYHTPWLSDAAARLGKWLQASPPSLAASNFPFFSSVLHRAIPPGDVPMSTVVAIVTRQLVEPVDFVGQLRAAREMGCFGFVEVGPGEACCRFVEDTLPEAERRVWPLARLLGLPAAARAPAPELTASKSRLFGRLARAISSVTGYELSSITIEDRFQEDLGIDSLKKAEILITVVRDGNPKAADELLVSGVQTLGDAVVLLEQQDGGSGENQAPESLDPPRRPPEFQRRVRNWVETPAGAPPSSEVPFLVLEIRSLFSALGTEALAEFARMPSASGRQLVLVDDGRNSGDPEGVGRLGTGILELQMLLRLVGQAPLSVAVITCDGSPAFAGALGAFFKSLEREMGSIYFRQIEFESWPGDDVVVARAREDLGRGSYEDVRYAGGRRFEGRFEGAPETAASVPGSLGAQEDAKPFVILAFGGARGITLELLRHLVAERRPWLHIVGRSPAGDASVASAVDALRPGCAGATYHALDASDLQLVDTLFAEIHGQHGRIDLVLNGAGVERSGILAGKAEADIRGELMGKLGPAIAILGAARRHPPARLIQFSSVAARFGNEGQAVYALASEAINRLTAEFAASEAGCAATSINWPPWDGVGMTAAPRVRQALLRSGVSLLPPESAWALFRRDLGSGADVRPVLDYLDPRDVWALSLGLRDLRDLAPLLGERRGFGGFALRLDSSRDGFLRDHRIGGRPYFPAAFGAIACHALALATGCGRTLADFRAEAPLVVGAIPVRLALHGTSTGEGALSLTGSTRAIHFSCRVPGDSGSPQPPESFSADIIRGLLSARPQRVVQPETIYGPQALFHGPTFQVLHRAILVESGELVAEMDSQSLRAVVGLGLWDRLIQATDACFQAVALNALLRHRLVALPTGFARAQFAELGAWPPKVRILTTGSRIDSDSIAGDVAVVDEGGMLLMAIRAITLRILRREAASAVVADAS